ncbi:MAG TPA: glycosyltransferase family 4 protein [Gaiella sp.]|nr:glycosyltransferase family 4 protein [Gaiella sp.]
MRLGLVHVAKVAGISGSENHLLLLLPALRERGHDVRLVMLHEGEPGAAELADRLERAGVPVERMRMRASIDPLVLGKLVRSIRRARPDVVHTHLVHADFHGLPAARLAGVPLAVSTKHGFNPFRNRRTFATADRTIARLADVHVAISAGLARYLAKHEGFDASAFEVVHYGIEPGPPPPAPPGGPRLAIVGRLIPIKGHEVLLEAVRRARDEVPRLTLEVAGDGPLDAQLRATVTRLELDDRVTFLGRVALPGPVYERAEIVVVPSFGEGFGMVALEAMERGRAVIASDVGGLPEIVAAGETGLVVPCGDPARLAEAIVELALDPARATGLGAAGRERAVSAFSQERCTERIESLYLAGLETGVRRRSRTSSQARSRANAASSASRKSQGTR